MHVTEEEDDEQSSRSLARRAGKWSIWTAIWVGSFAFLYVNPPFADGQSFASLMVDVAALVAVTHIPGFVAIKFVMSYWDADTAIPTKGRQRYPKGAPGGKGGQFR